MYIYTHALTTRYATKTLIMFIVVYYAYLIHYIGLLHSFPFVLDLIYVWDLNAFISGSLRINCDDAHSFFIEVTMCWLFVAADSPEGTFRIGIVFIELVDLW